MAARDIYDEWRDWQAQRDAERAAAAQDIRNGKYQSAAADKLRDDLLYETATYVNPTGKINSSAGNKTTENKGTAVWNGVRDIVNSTPDPEPDYYWDVGGSTPEPEPWNPVQLNYSGAAQPVSQSVAQSAVPSFTYESAPEYVSRYQSMIDEYLNNVLNRPAFSYDPATDPQYSAYRKQYAREGQRAAADVMGQYASMTGGMPSTAAVTASQQAGDYYAAQMADKIPELYQAAYQMYMDDYNRQMQNLNMLRALEGDDYGRYADQLSQYNTDRSFAYGLNRDAVSDARYADELAYAQAQDEYNRNLALAQLAAGYNDLRGIQSLGIDTSKYGKVYGGSGGSGTSKSDARNRIEAFGEMGYDIRELPEELLAAAGYSDAEINAMADYYAAQANKEDAYTPTYTATQASTQIRQGNYSPQALMDYQIGNGVDYIDTITSYDSAIKMLEGMGISEKPNTKSAWSRHKGQTNSNAAGADDWMFDYATYEDYLRDYLREARNVAYGF